MVAPGDLDRPVDMTSLEECSADDPQVHVVQVTWFDRHRSRSGPETDDQVAPAFGGELDPFPESRHGPGRLDDHLRASPAGPLAHAARALLGRLDLLEVD